jgi:hypothetical protein
MKIFKRPQNLKIKLFQNKLKKKKRKKKRKLQFSKIHKFNKKSLKMNGHEQFSISILKNKN